MIFYLYELFEERYHELKSSQCDCKPDLHILHTGDILLVHHSLVEDQKHISERIVERVISEITALQTT